MKKLMILAAVICAAVVSQAATINWQLTGSGTSQKNKAFYIFDQATYNAQIATLLTAGTSDGTFNSLLSTLSSKALASGQLDGTPYAEGSINLGDVATDSVSLYALVLNKNTTSVAAATKYYLSDVATGHSYTPSTPTESVKAKLDITDKTLTTLPKSTEPIPEPTSAMLLLLGVAGMALRRRRA